MNMNLKTGNKLLIFGFQTNETLDDHCKKILNFFPGSSYSKEVRRSNIEYITKLFFKVKFNSNFKKILVYNTSPKNLIYSLLQKRKKIKLIFHLHDPIPHSGYLNPFLFILNYLQLLLSDIIFVYHPQLVNQSKKIFPFINKKIFKIVQHGYPNFNYIKTDLNKNKINIGFFGRNMPYKNFRRFLIFAESNPQYSYIVVGKGYSKEIVESKNQNIEYFDGFVNNDLYYSILYEMDYIMLPYKDISFSGVLNDSIALGKKLIVSKLLIDIMFNKNMINIDSNDFQLSKQNISRVSLNGENAWKSYADSLNEI